MRGRTSIVVAHRLSTVRAANVIFVLREGHVVEKGRHEELLAACGPYAALWKSQFGSARCTGDPGHRREPHGHGHRYACAHVVR